MHALPLRLVLVMAALALGACSKKDATGNVAAAGKTPPAQPLAVQAVKESERSKSFAAVNRQLELGGTLYAYVDVEGDLLELTRGAQELLREVAQVQPNARVVAQQDLSAIVTMLGLTDVKALGVSSVPDGTGYFRNRAFVYTGGERRGLMAAMGGKPAPFKHVGLAPADAAFFAESEVDVAVVYKTVKDVLTKVAGEQASNQVETMLKKAGEAATLSFLDLIYGLKGRTALVGRIDPEKTFRFPGAQPLTVPAFSLVACVEGVGQVIEPTLAKARELKRTDSGTMKIFEPTRRSPIEGLEPAIVIDGSTVYLTTSLSFLKECRERKTGLAQTPEFQQALERLGKEGNGLTYVSPRLFTELKRIESLNPEMPAQAKSALAFALRQFPNIDRPLVSVRTNLDDGILIRSYLNRSLKQDIAAVGIYNPVTIGMLAAMAIPAFQKVRTASQEKAVLNNLRQLSAAADQYYLENGKTTATYDELVGPTRYIKVLNPVAGENYRALRFRQGEVLRVRLANGKTVEFGP